MMKFVAILKRSAYIRLAAMALVAFGLALSALADGGYTCCDDQACGGSCQSANYSCGGTLNCACSCSSWSADCGYSGCQPSCLCMN